MRELSINFSKKLDLNYDNKDKFNELEHIYNWIYEWKQPGCKEALSGS